ncbi:hypothetical protein J2848_000525 [Azospirillum lipoferum]|uniref:Uncharacterized protein n=1 Tax=Azospirillum lipoferum TaxID=193 RepID=A0A5A9G122_AZOLI|nr:MULTISPECIES: hypothetical protein [Azospirillum]KAA0587555.1 hypothetical protein FZ942_34040 [Azospirillum lipoferum]MCP1608889.1 hypothetical protein [Azospirillum lipoferum]MDW5535796.1 hypothetical protein [Azospirillum sp. NL1]
MTSAFSQIRHADGRAYYQGSPLSLADAQIMLNDDILRRRVRVGAYLRVDGGRLVLVNGPALQRSVFRPVSSALTPRAGRPE